MLVGALQLLKVLFPILVTESGMLTLLRDPQSEKALSPILVTPPEMLTLLRELQCLYAENGGYPPTQNGDIRSLFWLFSLMALQN